MNAPATTGKAFAVMFQDLMRWDYLSLSLARFSNVRTPLKRVGDLFTIRKEVVSAESSHRGEASMLEKVTFDGEVFLGREQTRMTQYLAKPGDLIISKIRARQGSVGLLHEFDGNASVTIHYRVLCPQKGILPDYAWLVFRSNYVRNQFLASTGGAMKGEISEEALLDLNLPCPTLEQQTAIVEYSKAALTAVQVAESALSSPVKDLNDRLTRLYRAEAGRDVIHTRHFALDFKDLSAWDVKAGRAAAFRLACPSFRPLGDFIEDASETVRPFDEPGKEWPVYGVSNKDGVFLNSMQRGDAFNAPFKRIRKDWFFHNPTRCNVGSLGMVPIVPEDAITSPEYQVWRVKPDAAKAMLPGFLACLIQTPFFIELVQFNRVGAVKQRMYTENLCQLRIPYLSVAEQKEYVRDRGKAIAALGTAKQRLERAKREIEAMILGTRKAVTP